MRRTLIVTNDFPPRPGGIQSFVHELARRLPPERLTVYAPAWDGAAQFDAKQPFEVIRHPTSLMLPVPSVTRRAAAIAKTRHCEAVIFGAAAPLGLIALALRRAGVGKAIAITHGHEAGWAALPGARALLRRIGDQTDVVTYLGEYFRLRLASALSPAAAARMTRLHPGVDAAHFRPDPEARETIRARYGLVGRPVVVCVSRLVRRKGQDTLLKAWPKIKEKVPDAALLIVSGGPREAALHKLSERTGRRLCHALPDPARRARRGGARHRLPGGVGDRPAGGRRRLRRRAGRDPGRRDRLRRARPGHRRAGRAPHRAAVRPGHRPRDGRQGPRLG